MKQMYVVRVAFLRRIKNECADFCADRFRTNIRILRDVVFY